LPVKVQSLERYSLLGELVCTPDARTTQAASDMTPSKMTPSEMTTGA
jgi:hypothetical protein